MTKGKEQQGGGEHNVNAEYNVGAAGFQIHVSVANRGGGLNREVQAFDERPVFHATKDTRRNEEKHDDEGDGAHQKELVMTVHLSFREVARLLQKRFCSISVLDPLRNSIVDRTKNDEYTDEHGKDGEQTTIVV